MKKYSKNFDHIRNMLVKFRKYVKIINKNCERTFEKLVKFWGHIGENFKNIVRK